MDRALIRDDEPQTARPSDATTADVTYARTVAAQPMTLPVRSSRERDRLLRHVPGSTSKMEDGVGIDNLPLRHDFSPGAPILQY
jgi:hypothetical protein